MTTEDDFQAMLDANPEDWQTRLIFADWLEERGDARAEGYRALGKLRRVPNDTKPKHEGYVFLWSSDKMEEIDNRYDYVLPSDWYRHLSATGEMYGSPPLFGIGKYKLKWKESRREGEDKAALAFSLLPHERRAELLSSTLTSAT